MIRPDPTAGEWSASPLETSASLCRRAVQAVLEPRAGLARAGRARAERGASRERRIARARGLAEARFKAGVPGAVRRLGGRVARLQQRAGSELADGPDPVISVNLARLNSRLERVLVEQQRGTFRP
jgi:hypothetical protein